MEFNNLKYKPSRDIPKAVEETRSISPTIIVNWIKNHRMQRGKGGRMQQVIRSPESITMWFKDHPVIYEQLKTKVVRIETVKEIVTDATFENGTFRNLQCIKEWITKLRAKGAKDQAITKFVGGIKQICQGILPHKKGRIAEWGLKHPLTLTLNDAITYLAELQKLELRTRRHRLSIRSFFKYRNIAGYEEIGGELEEEAGQYADLFVSKEKINKIFEYLKEMNHEAYMASYFAYKTASRLTATLNAHASYLNMAEHRITVLEKASTRKKKSRKQKYIPPDLWAMIRKEGKLFRIEALELNGLLRSAYKRIIPEMAERIPMPFHFWRHMFAQHMLRAKEWNYAIVAKLGGWTTGALERYYGKMSFDTAFELGHKAVENL